MGAVLGGCAGAIVAGVFGIIMWILQRRAALRDKKDDKKDIEKKQCFEKFNAAISKMEEFIEELGMIKADVSELRANNIRQDEDRQKDKALDARRRILRFADEVRRGEKHSQEHFNNVFADITTYTNYCHEHPDFENDKAVVSIKCIRQVYEQCTLDNSFL